MAIAIERTVEKIPSSPVPNDVCCSRANDGRKLTAYTRIGFPPVEYYTMVAPLHLYDCRGRNLQNNLCDRCFNKLPKLSDSSVACRYKAKIGGECSLEVHPLYDKDGNMTDRYEYCKTHLQENEALERSVYYNTK